jgi:3-hydroxyisobutyrate dehydrogenase-like beta-hydroxyacid dehydrogenase
MLRTRAPLVLEPPEQPWFEIELMHKDMLLAMHAAEDLPADEHPDR